jgi:hypothetical protein
VFQIQSKKLQKQFIAFIESLTDPNLVNFAKTIYKFTFGDPRMQLPGEDGSILQALYKTFTTIPEIEQILSRTISRFTNEEFSEKSLYRLFALVIFLNALQHYLHFDPTSTSTKISPEKYKTLSDYLQKLPRCENLKTNSLEDILNHILHRSIDDIDRIRQTTTLEGILQYVFGSNPLQQGCEVQEIGQRNLKQEILILNLKGTLIEKIFAQYDGLLQFAMGILTMITGTELDTKEIKDALNTLLDALGASSKVTLLLQRMRKNWDERNRIFDQMHGVAVYVIETVQRLDIPMATDLIVKFFEIATSPPIFNHASNILPKIEELPGFHQLFENSRLTQAKEQLIEVWSTYRQNYADLHPILNDLSQFLEGLIKKANEIIRDLQRKKFKAILPVHDITTIQNAGIDITPILGVASSPATDIPVEIKDQHQKMWRQFDSDRENLKKLMEKWQTEESIIRNIDSNLLSFTDINESIRYMIEELQTQGVFKGTKEEIYFSIRVLGAFEKILAYFIQILDPLKNQHLNRANMDKFRPILLQMAQYLLYLKEISKIALIVNQISKALYYTQRDLISAIGLDSKYLYNPKLLRDAVLSIPEILQKELQQKMITKEQKEAGLKNYELIMNLIQQLQEIPQDYRILLPTLEQILQTQ